MKLALFLLPRAEADLDAHCAFFGNQSIEKALLFDQAVFDSLERLCEIPLVGSERKFYNRKLWGIRLWFVKGFEKYLIFYRVFDNYIEIVRFLHSAQDVDSIMEDENIN